MKTVFENNWGLLVRHGAFALSCLAAFTALTGLAKEPPKVTFSDREIDRSIRGASYAPVIKRVTPSVVTIQSTRTLRSRGQNWSQFFDDPTFRQFFGQNPDPRSNRPRKQTAQSLGSGVIVSEDGFILTNNHVIEGADPNGVEVALADGKTKYTAQVVGTDPRTDVAVLKIEAKKLPALTLADSDKLEVGDIVLAIGNPFNVGQSVTMGIVSALGRGIGVMDYEDFIQTDAAINPGNSGGALVDNEGRLIGINQSIASPNGGNSGVGFAIPINLARNAMEKLTTDGKITRGYLGVNPQTVTAEFAKEFKLPDNSGALVGGVQPNTPAEAAGLKEGDVIIEMAGKKVTDPRHLRLTVSQTPPKTKVNMIVIRDGKEKTFTVTLAALPDELGGDSSEGSNVAPDAKTDQLEGVEVGDLDSRARQKYEITSRVKGALVTKVDPDCTAAEAGLREGDVIVELNRQPVADAEQAVEFTKKAKGDRILLRVYSQTNGLGATRYLSVEAAKKK